MGPRELTTSQAAPGCRTGRAEEIWNRHSEGGRCTSSATPASLTWPRPLRTSTDARLRGRFGSIAISLSLSLRSVPPKVAAERLGHADPTLFSNLYSHMTPTMQQDAARRLGAALFEAQ